MDYLFLASISPVQDFISQARKTKDLYAGSKMLSEIIRYIITNLQKEVQVDLIFPEVNSQSLPNRFVLKLDNRTPEEVTEVGKKINSYYDTYLHKILKNIEDKLKISLPEKSNEQFLHLLTLTWSAVELTNDFESSYQQLEKQQAGSKTLRTFSQLGQGQGETGRKCSICGERNAYFCRRNKSKSLRGLVREAVEINSDLIDDKEALCLVELVKRFSFDKDSFPSTAELALQDRLYSEDINLLKSKNINLNFLYENNFQNLDINWKEKVANYEELQRLIREILERNKLSKTNLPTYYATIIFDGDNMGSLLSGKRLKDKSQLEEFHRVMTSALAVNAEKAKQIVDKHGRTVYAGGDDFLGFSSIGSLFSVLKDLDTAFKDNVQSKLAKYVEDPEEITISVGLAIAHYKSPLQSVLNQARAQEKYAKEEAGRNAVALLLNLHSGSVLSTCWNWRQDYEMIGNIETIISALVAKDFSTNFIYSIIAEFQLIDTGDSKLSIQSISIEVKRLIGKSCMILRNENESKEDYNQRKNTNIDKLSDRCMALYRHSGDNKNNFYDLLKIISFFARDLGGIK
jgi:CRISPR-associated protein Cmr2